jgi:hypothetical protein
MSSAGRRVAWLHSNNLVDAGEQCGRHDAVERLRCLKVDRQLEFFGRLHRKLTRFHASPGGIGSPSNLASFETDRKLNRLAYQTFAILRFTASSNPTMSLRIGPWN